MSRRQAHRLALRNIFVRALSLRDSHQFVNIDDELAGRLQKLGGLLGEW